MEQNILVFLPQAVLDLTNFLMWVSLPLPLFQITMPKVPQNDEKIRNKMVSAFLTLNNRVALPVVPHRDF